MASYRPDKLGSVIRGITSDLIASKLQDPRISPFTTVTRVEVSGDLLYAKIHISVMGEESEQRRTLAGLEHARGHVQREIAKSIVARNAPRIQFVLDQSIKNAARIFQLIDESLPKAEEVEEEDIDEEGKDDSPDGAAS
jgi:ribosome-binding factor A